MDVVSPSGEARRDMVVELGAGRMVDELEDALTGMSPGETKDVEHGLADGSTARLTVTLNEIKEKVLPPADDDLARGASEFDTLAELRADIEERLRDQISAEIESGFRAATADTLVQASGVQPSGPLVDSRANELLSGFLRTLESRGISPETYLVGVRIRRPTSCATSCAPRPRCPSRESSCSMQWRNSSVSRCPTRRSKRAAGAGRVG